MAVSPLDTTALDAITPTDANGNAVPEDVTPQPNKTYSLDLESGDINGIIDGESAIRQFIRKAILTARFRFLVYDDQYGCELEDLIGQDVTLEYLQSEVPRVITESLIYDDRVDDVDGFSIDRDGDEVYIEFTVYLTDGTQVTMQEVA